MASYMHRCWKSNICMCVEDLIVLSNLVTFVVKHVKQRYVGIYIKLSKLITFTVIKQSKYAWSWHLTGFITQCKLQSLSILLQYWDTSYYYRCECPVSTCSLTSGSQNFWCTCQVYKMVENNNFYFNLIILFQMLLEKAYIHIYIYCKAWIAVCI